MYVTRNRNQVLVFSLACLLACGLLWTFAFQLASKEVILLLLYPLCLFMWFSDRCYWFVKGRVWRHAWHSWDVRIFPFREQKIVKITLIFTIPNYHISCCFISTRGRSRTIDAAIISQCGMSLYDQRSTRLTLFTRMYYFVCTHPDERDSVTFELVYAC